MHCVGWFAFQYVTTTESMYNSRVREKSSTKHFKKESAGAGRRRGAAPASAAPQLGSEGTAPGARPRPLISTRAISLNHALCKLRLRIGQMVDKHFFS